MNEEVEGDSRRCCGSEKSRGAEGEEGWRLLPRLAHGWAGDAPALDALLALRWRF